jgi:hypothetical protein
MTSKSRAIKAPGDSTLQGLWRQVVRLEWGNRCALAGTYFRDQPGQGHYCEGELECHHEKRRRIPHLRHCPANGVLICQHHHALAKYRVWQERIRTAIGPEKMEYLDAMEQKLFPVFLAEQGLSRTEYLIKQKTDLQDELARYRGVA